MFDLFLILCVMDVRGKTCTLVQSPVVATEARCRDVGQITAKHMLAELWKRQVTGSVKPVCRLKTENL